MVNQTRVLCKANLDKKIFISDVPNTLTYREHIREMEEELGMCPEPIDLYGDDDLIEYVEELASIIYTMKLSDNLGQDWDKNGTQQ